jgi:hypothetical protein
MKKSKLAVLATLAALSGTTPASAQARSLEGFAMPVIYDSHGVQHYFVNGYYGEIMPAMPGKAAGSLWRGNVRARDAHARADKGAIHRRKVSPR